MMLKITLITTTLLLFLGCNQSRIINVETKERVPEIITSQNIVNVPIYKKDKGYKNFSTKILTSQSELDDFLATIKKQSNWKRKKNFLYILEKQEIDFSKDSLVIYRFSEPSSAIVIATEVPTEKDKLITVKIGKKRASVQKKLDVVDYALAYIVNKQTKTIIFDDGELKNSIVINKP